MIRSKPYYSKKQICKCISEGKVFITEQAQCSASNCFGWDFNDINEAMKKLPNKYWYKSEQRFENPEVWVDYYRARNLLGEDIYTHFYIENDILFIDSFKRI